MTLDNIAKIQRMRVGKYCVENISWTAWQASDPPEPGSFGI